MRIDWWTLALQTINLLVLVWLLSRYLFRPIAAIIAQRQAQADRLLQDAETVHVKAEEAEKAAERAAAEAAEKRGELIKAATQEAADTREKLIEQARAEAERLRDQARHDGERERTARREQDVAEANHLAVDIAGRLLDRLPDDARVDSFAAGLVQALRQLPKASREEFGANGQPVTLKAARALSTAEQATLTDSIAGELGRKIALEVQVDPDLIAGLEIETPHAAVRNSFRDDLSRIAAELTRSDDRQA